MTPLAHQIASDLTRPVKDREHPDWVHDLVRDVHCFEVTEVMDLVNELFMATWDEPSTLEFCNQQMQNFLPAPFTWIEWCKKTRDAVLITDDGRLTLIERMTDGYMAVNDCRYEWADDGLRLFMNEDAKAHIEQDKIIYTLRWVRAALAIINSPRLIGRKQHMPHRGLERKLVRSQKLVGKFPLHAWTELKLSVSDIGKRDDGTEYEAHYTGEKCLHFCRSHLRIRNGRLERVKAHWRGNPALGIKQTRYRLTA